MITMSKLRIIELEQQLAEATARADDAEGINLAVTEQMKIIASFTDNTASVKAEGIREAVKSIKFTGCRADDSMLKTYIEFLVEYAKSLEDKT